MTQDKHSSHYFSQRPLPIHPSATTDHVVLQRTVPRDQAWMREKTSNSDQTIEVNMRAEEMLGLDERNLIKEELRLSIQSKRLARGLPGNVEIEYKKPQPEKISAEDMLKRERRRERNKVAAAKCRFKKKIVSERLQEESDQLEHINMKLAQEIERLQGEKQKLSAMLELHESTCVASHVSDLEVEPSISTSLSSLFHTSVNPFSTSGSCFTPTTSIFDPPSSSNLHLTQSC